MLLTKQEKKPLFSKNINTTRGFFGVKTCKVIYLKAYFRYLSNMYEKSLTILREKCPYSEISWSVFSPNADCVIQKNRPNVFSGILNLYHPKNPRVTRNKLNKFEFGRGRFHFITSSNMKILFW